MNTIQHYWESFEASVVPKTAGPVQRQEMRRAFYAGAIAMQSIQFTVGDEDISEDAAIGILEGCRLELEAFAENP